MFAAESFPRLRSRHLVQVRLIDLLPILNSGSLILPNFSSLCILGVIEPYNPRDPNLRVSAGGSSLGPQLSSLTLAAKLKSPFTGRGSGGSSSGSVGSDDEEGESFSFPDDFLPECTSLRHLTLGPPQSSNLEDTLEKLDLPRTLESISVSYVGLPDEEDMAVLAGLVLHGQDPRELVEVKELEWAGEGILWRGREHGTRFYDDAGSTLLWEDVVRLCTGESIICVRLRLIRLVSTVF